VEKEKVCGNAGMQQLGCRKNAGMGKMQEYKLQWDMLMQVVNHVEWWWLLSRVWWLSHL
jgi:hypothetical protein